VTSGLRLPEGTRAFDFVQEESSATPGFTAVPMDRSFERAGDFGWRLEPGQKSVPKMWRHCQNCYPTQLLGHTVKKATFSCALPDGAYVCSLFMGSIWRTQLWYMNHVATAGGRTVVDDGRSIEDLMDAEYFRYMHDTLVTTDDIERKGEAVFDRYIRPRFRRHDFTVEVKGGRLDLRAASGCMSAVVMSPAVDAAAHRRAMAELDALQVEEFAEKWAGFVEPDATRGRKIGSYRPSDSDRRRGYVVSRRHWMQAVEYNSRPDDADVGTDLELFATPGQYEPVAFSIWPLRDLEDVGVKVSDLRSLDGTTIPASAVRIWYLQQKHLRTPRPAFTFTFQGTFLPDWGPSRNLFENITQRCWLSVKVPEDAAGGVYTGEVTVSPRNAPSATLQLSLRVLPFELIRPGRLHPLRFASSQINMPFTGRYPIAENDIYNRHWYRKMALEDLHEHGFAPEFDPWWPSVLDYETGEIAWDRPNSEIWGEEDHPQPHHIRMVQGDRLEGPLEDVLKVIKDSPFGRGNALFINGWSNRSLAQQIQSGPLPEWTRGMENWLTDLSRKMLDYGFTFCPIMIYSEEGHTVGAENAQQWADRMDYIRQGREEGKWPNLYDTTSCITYWGEAVAARHSDRPGLGMFHGTSKDAEAQIEMARSTGRPFTLYGNRGRMVPGFYLWKAGASGTFHEFYAPVCGIPNNDWDSRLGGGGGPDDILIEAPGHTNAMYSPTGRMIGTWFWEELRAGVDDDAYLYTLETMIHDSADDDRPAVRQARAAAERTLADVRDAIDLDLLPMSGLVYRPFPPEDFDALRWKVASSALRLVAAREKDEALIAGGGDGKRALLASVKFVSEPEIDGDPRPMIEPSVFHVRPVAERIEIDGQLSEDFWRGPPVVEQFRNMIGDKELIEPCTSVWVGADSDNLYVGVRCMEPKMDDIDTSAGDIFRNDCIEVYIDIEHTHASYVHFGVDASGRTFSARYTRDSAKYGYTVVPLIPIPEDSWSVKTHLGTDQWTVEMCIPRKDFGIHDRSVFGMNVARHAPNRNLSAWTLSPVFSFHQAKYYADVYMPGAPCLLERFTPGPMAAGPNTASVWLHENSDLEPLRVGLTDPLGVPLETQITRRAEAGDTVRYDIDFGLSGESAEHLFNLSAGDMRLGEYSAEFDASCFSATLERGFILAGRREPVALDVDLHLPAGTDLNGFRFALQVMKDAMPFDGKSAATESPASRRFRAMLDLADLPVGVYDLEVKMLDPNDQTLKRTLSEFEILAADLVPGTEDASHLSRKPIQFETEINLSDRGGAITHNRHKDWSPVVSEDGGTMVFLSHQANPDIWKLDLTDADAQPVQLTNTPDRKKGLVLSADGKKLAYLVAKGLGTHVFVQPIDGEAVELCRGNDAIFSPDDRYAVSRDANFLFMTDLQSGERFNIVAAGLGDVNSIRWRATESRQWIYYIDGGNIWRIEVDGTRACGEREELFASDVEEEGINFISFELARGTDAASEKLLAIQDYSSLAIVCSNRGIVLYGSEGKETRRRPLGEMDCAVWSGPDEVVFSHQGTLYLQSLSGRPVCIAGSGNGCDDPFVLPKHKWLYYSARQPERRSAVGAIRPKYSEIYRARLR